MNSFEIRTQNDLDALRAIHKFGWLRAQELGLWLWPTTSTKGHTQACRAAKSWIERGLVIARKLPEQSGFAYVLAKKGVEMLTEEGIEARSGKDIGSVLNDVWYPPANWKHELLAAGVLIRIARDIDVLLDGEVELLVTDAMIRRKGEKLGKIPDGLVVYKKKDGAVQQVVWVEVEQSKKSSLRDVKPLAEALSLAANSKIEAVFGYKATAAMVIFDKDSELNHKQNVTNAILGSTKDDVAIRWASCTTTRYGVTEVEHSNEVLKADNAARILKFLKSNFEPETKTLTTWRATYGKYQLKIIESKPEEFDVFVNDECRVYRAGTLKEAEIAAAEIIEKLLNEAKAAKR